MAGKFALLIACSQYTDPTLSRLDAPAADVERLRDVLADSDIGGFEVEVLPEPGWAEMQYRLHRFLASRARDDLVVVYFSGHGYRDRKGNFYLTAVDTELDYARGTAVLGSHLQGMLEDCGARGQVLVLDCCFSAAFVGKGRKAASPVGQPAELPRTLADSGGDGRYVITATGANEYAFEVGGDVEGLGVRSRFTSFLVEGLATGAADTDSDGRITADELFEYARLRIAETADPSRPQTPEKYLSQQRAGAVVLARSRASADSRQMLAKAMAAVTDPLRAMRVAGVTVLAELLANADEDPSAAEQARLRLAALAADNQPDEVVRQAAQVALAGGHVGAALQSKVVDADLTPVGERDTAADRPDGTQASLDDDPRAGPDDLRASLHSSDGETVPAGPVRFSVRLRNAGPRPLSGLEVLLDGQSVASDILIEPGKRRRLRAHLTLAGSGLREVRLLVVGPRARGGLVKAEASCTIELQAPAIQSESPSWLAAPEVSGEWTSVSNDLRWAAVEGAEEYVVERATDEAFSDAVVVQEGDLLFCFDWFSRDDFPHHVGTLWYRVQARAAARTGFWSRPVEISENIGAAAEVPAVPSTEVFAGLLSSWLATPEVSGEWTSVSNDLRWAAVEGAEEYVVERATDEAFSDAVVVQEGDSLFCFDWFSRDDFPHHVGTVWYRVRARATSRTGFWSRPVEISGDFSPSASDTPAPRWPGLLERFGLSGGELGASDAPPWATGLDLSSPSMASGPLEAPLLFAQAEAGAVTTAVRLWWTPVAAATSYEVQGSLFHDFTSPLEVYSGPDTSTIYPAADLLVWSFRVRALLGSVAGPWSDTARWGGPGG
jgi:Caspase domain